LAWVADYIPRQYTSLIFRLIRRSPMRCHTLTQTFVMPACRQESWIRGFSRPTADANPRLLMRHRFAHVVCLADDDRGNSVM